MSSHISLLISPMFLNKLLVFYPIKLNPRPSIPLNCPWKDFSSAFLTSITSSMFPLIPDIVYVYSSLRTCDASSCTTLLSNSIKHPCIISSLLLNLIDFYLVMSPLDSSSESLTHFLILGNNTKLSTCMLFMRVSIPCGPPLPRAHGLSEKHLTNASWLPFLSISAMNDSPVFTLPEHLCALLIIMPDIIDGERRLVSRSNTSILKVTRKMPPFK